VSPIPPIDPEATPTGFQKAMHSMGTSAAGRWYGINVGARIDPFLLKATGGRFATTGFFPLVQLITRGRRSGQERTVPLVYFTQGDEVILMASSFGRAKNPAWYYNAIADPHVRLAAKGEKLPYLVRDTEGGERDRLFELATRLYRGYGLYAERATNRTIPVLALSPEG
jgi:deazaflavin-dependent oxidoreductase (nitroreductase family)